jgi:very-short-patch-repair endonuclease
LVGVDATVSGQQGVIRRDQALAAGLSRARIDDLVRRRRWRRVHPSVFLVGTAPITTAGRVHAAWLWAGERAAVAGPAAAWWWGLAPPPDRITLIVPPPSRRAARPGVTIVRGRVDPKDLDVRNWVRVTTVPRTCLDLARLGEPDRLDAALRMRRTDAARLEASLERSRGRRGQALARLAVDDVAANPWGFSERLLHRRLRDAGVTGWTANPPVRLRHGVRYPDIALEDIRLAIEMDGRQFHGDPRSFEADRERNNDFVEAGWTVLHFTWKQLTEDGASVVTSIERTIALLRQRHPSTVAGAGS